MSKATELIELLKLINEQGDIIKPMLETSVDKILESGPTFSKLLEAVGVGVAKMFAAQHKYYIAEGFSQGQAMELTTAYIAFMGKKR
jgi:hypothetical protein